MVIVWDITGLVICMPLSSSNTIFVNAQTVRLIVDHCDNSIVTETVNTTEEDRTMCESRYTFTGDHYLLNVYTPLELGGRAKPAVSYPPGLPTVGFDGCLKNLMYVDKVRVVNTVSS